MKDVDELDKNFYTMANNKNQNIVVNKENNEGEGSIHSSTTYTRCR